MKNRIISLIGLVMIIFAIIFRAFCYAKVEAALNDRDNTLKNNQETLLYYELDGMFDVVETSLSNINEDDLRFICDEATKQDSINKLIKIKAEIEYIDNIHVAVLDGQIYSSSMTSDSSITERENWYIDSIKTKKQVLVAKDANTSSSTIIVTSPLYIDGIYRGVIAGEIDGDKVKKIINSTCPTVKQVYIRDCNGDIMYKLNKISNITPKDITRVFKLSKNENVITFTNHIYTLETIYNNNEALGYINSLKISFSILYTMIIIFFMFRIFNSKGKRNLIRSAFIMFIMLLIEWIFIAVNISKKYDEDMNSLIDITKYHMKYTENILGKVADQVYGSLTKEITVQDAVINENTKTIIGRATSSLKTIFSSYKGAFFIDKDGLYSFIPEIENDAMTTINFKNNRLLLNDYFKSSIICFDRIDNGMMFTKLYKIKDEYGNIFGVIGVNFNVTPIITFISDNFSDGKNEEIFEVLEDGSLYSNYYKETYQYEDGKTYNGNIEFTFTEDKKNTLLKNEQGVISSTKGINSKRYVYITDYDDETKNIIYLSLERNIKIGDFFMIFIIVLFVALCVLAFIARIIAISNSNYLNVTEFEYKYEKDLSNQSVPTTNEDEQLIQRLHIFNKEEFFNTDKISLENVKTIFKKMKEKINTIFTKKQK